MTCHTANTRITLRRGGGPYRDLFSEALAAVGVPIGRRAYIDESRRCAIAAVFRTADDFDCGVATTQLGPAGDGRQQAPDYAWVLLHKPGAEKALDPSIATVRGFSADSAACTSGDGLSGYVDRTEAIRIPATFALVRPFCADSTAEVHAGWCPPGTSNPAGLPMVDRSVRFRHTSASLSAEGCGKLPDDPG